MIQVCIMAIAGVFAGMILKKEKPELAAVIILLISLCIGIRVFGVVELLIDEIRDWTNLLGENDVYIGLLLKMIGITYLCEFASNLCKDNGYSALGNHIEIFGKITIMVAGLPAMKMMLSMIEDVIR